MSLITVQDVTIAFEGVNAIEHASFSVEKGDYLVLIGENGSGKSTLVRMMLGLIKPISGSVSYGDGLTRNGIGYLPQQTEAQRHFPASVEEVVMSGCAGSMAPGRFFYGKEVRDKAEEKMRMLGIETIRKKSYRTLSGGQQQRVLLARALCAADKILFLDEPVTGLDPNATWEMYQILGQLNRENGMGIVMVTHDLDAGVSDAKHVLLVNKGVEFWGTIEEYKAGVRYGQRA